MRTSRGFTLIELLIVVAIIGIIAAFAIPNLLGALDRGRQTRTMNDILALGKAIQAYAVDNIDYPTAADATDLAQVLEPDYMGTVPRKDGWNRDLQISSTPLVYTLCSGGKDGGTCLADGAGAFAAKDFNASITYSNGQFVQWPSGVGSK